MINSTTDKYCSVVVMSLLPSGKMQLMERDALEVVGLACVAGVNGEGKRNRDYSLMNTPYSCS